MKKTFLILGLLIIGFTLSAQSWARYGIRVGLDPTNVVVTDFERVGNSVHFYAGVTNMGTLWDGAGTALNAATGRTSLGATTVGAAFFMLTNPGAITFPRINADNSVTALSATDFKTALSLNDTVALETIVTLQADSVPLYVFGGGGANAGDTTSFTTSTVYGSYKVRDTTIITGIDAVMIAGTTPLGTDTLGIQIYFNDSINVTTGGSVRLLNAATLGINSVTTGTVDASFANNTIYPGERIFMKSPGVMTGRKPIYLEVTVYGHIQNRAY